MKVLYFGTLEWGTTSQQRMMALGDIVDDLYGVDTRIVISEYVKRGSWERFKIRTAWPPLVSEMGELLVREATRYSPDTVWVDQGILVSELAIERVRSSLPGARLLHYTPDSILAPGMTNKKFRKALTAYDLCITTKKREIDLYRSLGARRVLFSWQGYDDAVHVPAELTKEERELFTSDVVFIGQYMPKRAEYLAGIAEKTECRLGLYGRGWKNGPTGPVLGSYDRGWLYGDDYAKAISGSKIALCFLNDEVGDDYTTRTFEIPACGAMMLAERSEAHSRLFAEKKEADYFDTAEECLELVEYYLSHDDERRKIAAAGHKKVTSSGFTWRDRMSECISALEAL